MPRKYHIAVKSARVEAGYVHKFRIVRGAVCINCGKCTKVCIYEAHRRSGEDPRRMADPDTAVCRNCFRCIQECPQGALVKSLDPEYLGLGGEYWTPDVQIGLWKQAEDGKVPVSGAGYRGPFTGPGFDGMWTDMSEIVRPTRDGIHGREYISTAVEVGRKLSRLEFDARGNLVSCVPPTVDIPLPVIFDDPAVGRGLRVDEACIEAAARLETFIILSAARITPALRGPAVIPRLAPGDIERHAGLLRQARLIEIDHTPELRGRFPVFRERLRGMTDAVVIIRLAAAPGVEADALRLASDGVEAFHVAADYRGREAAGGRYIKEVIREVHGTLVEAHLRDQVTFIASGGMAMAEHVPKAMICGADLAAVDVPLLIALGAKVHEEPEVVLLPEDLAAMPVETMVQRMVNLMGAWHSQLLEVMGAMGIREARRLRGETGRAIFFEDIDREIFGKIFGANEEKTA